MLRFSTSLCSWGVPSTRHSASRKAQKRILTSRKLPRLTRLLPTPLRCHTKGWKGERTSSQSSKTQPPRHHQCECTETVPTSELRASLAAPPGLTGSPCVCLAGSWRAQRRETMRRRPCRSCAQSSGLRRENWRTSDWRHWVLPTSSSSLGRPWTTCMYVHSSFSACLPLAVSHLWELEFLYTVPYSHIIYNKKCCQDAECSNFGSHINT